MSHSIYFDIYIKADQTRLFNAIALPDELINWWPLKCSGTPEKGCVYNLNFTDQYDWFAEVIGFEKDKLFAWKMQKSDDDWFDTIVRFEIESQGKGVNLKFCHEGWPKLNHHFRKSSFCWALLLNGLKQYVEEGVMIPFEQRA